MLKSSILHFIIIGLFSSVLLGSSTTISELKSADKNTIDFTFNSVNKTGGSKDRSKKDKSTRHSSQSCGISDQ